MSTEAPALATPVAAPAKPAVAAPAAAPSPKSAVPPVGSSAAHMENAKKIFAPDPAKAAPVAAEPVKPAEPVKAAAEPVKAAEPAKPVEATPEFPEDKLTGPAENASDAAKNGWKELKSTAKALRNEKLVLENQLKELQSKQTTTAPTAADTAELERVRSELKTAHDRLLVVDLRNHPDFDRQYVQPAKKAFEESKTLLADNGIDAPVDFAALVTKPRADFAKAVSELAGKMNAFDAQTFTANMRQAYALKGEEAAALSKAGEVHQGLQQKTQQVQRQAFDAVASDLVPNFKKVEVTADMSPEAKSRAESYNQSVDTLRGSAEKIAFGKLGEKDVAMLAFKGAALDRMVSHAVPHLEAHVKSQNQVISDLRSELESLRGKKSPPAGGGGEQQQAAPNESFEQAAKRVWGKA